MKNTKTWLLALTLSCGLFGGRLSADTLVWDPSQNGAGSDGDGVWDNTASNTVWAGSNGDVYYSGTSLNINAATVVGGTTMSFANIIGLAVGQSLVGKGVPAGTIITNISGNEVTISKPLTEVSNSGQNFVFGGDVIFGAAAGAAGNVTVSGNQWVASLTINPSASGTYVFGGGTITLGSNGNGYFKVNSSVVFNTVVNATNSNGAGNVTLASGVTLELNKGGLIMAGNFSGSNGAAAPTVTVKVGGTTSLGNATFNNLGDPNTGSGGLRLIDGASLSYGGGMQIANSGSAYANIATGATLSITGGGGQLSLGRNGTANMGRLDIDGGFLNIASSSVLPVFLGRGSGYGVLNLNSGTFNVSATRLAIAHDNNSRGTLNISGGVATVREIQFGGADNNNATSATSGTGILNLSGGALYMGGGGMVNKGAGTAKYFVNLNGGILGADEDWNSALDMTLSGTTEIKAASAAGVRHDITLGGVLSTTSGGSFTKTGAGTLLLTGTSILGGATVAAGSLQVDGELTLGTLTFALDGADTGLVAGGGKLTLDAIAFDMASAGGLGTWNVSNIFDVSLTVNYSSGFSISGWNLENDGSWLSGDGLYSFNNGIITAIPEPSTWALLLSVAALLVALRKRR